MLRIVETPVGATQCFYICENIPHGECNIIDKLKPHKLVIRNVWGGSVPFPENWSLPRETKEVVVILPTARDRYQIGVI